MVKFAMSHYRNVYRVAQKNWHTFCPCYLHTP